MLRLVLPLGDKSDEPAGQRLHHGGRLPRRAGKRRAGPAQRQQTPVKLRQFPESGRVGAPPVQPVAGQRAFIAVVAAVLGAAELLPRLHKRHALHGQVNSRRQPVLGQQRFIGVVPVFRVGGGAQLVPQGQVVVGGNVLHHLPCRLGRKAALPAAPCAQRVEQLIPRAVIAVHIPRRGGVKHIALDGVPGVVTEKANARIQPVQRRLVRRARPVFHAGGAARPRLAVEQDVPPAWQCVQRGTHRVHGIRVLQRHQIKPESVDMVFLRPEHHRIYNVLAHHGPLAGKVAAAAGAVGEFALGGAPVPVAGDGAFQPGIRKIGVVVHHVHHHAQTGFVQRLHHGPALPHPHRAVEGVGGVAALRHVVIQRVVAPVVAAGGGLPDGGVVKHRHQLDVADAQPFQIIQAGGMDAVAVQRGVRQREGPELAPQTFGHPTVGVGGKIRHMALPDAPSMGRDDGAHVLRPALRRGGRQVQHHAPGAVRPGGAGVGVHHFGVAAVRKMQPIGIVHAVQIAIHRSAPDSLPRRRHGMLPQQRGVRLLIGAGGKQPQRDPLGRGRPQLEHRALRRPHRAKILTGIIRQCRRLILVHPITPKQRPMPGMAAGNYRVFIVA